MDFITRSATRNPADVELEPPLASAVRHRIVARRSVGKGEPGKPARREGQLLRSFDDKQDTLDIVGGVDNHLHQAVQQAAWMGRDLIVATEPGNARVSAQVARQARMIPCATSSFVSVKRVCSR